MWFEIIGLTRLAFARQTPPFRKMVRPQIISARHRIYGDTLCQCLSHNLSLQLIRPAPVATGTNNHPNTAENLH